MTSKQIKRFKEKLKTDGRTLTWFHAKYIKKKMTREAMYQQFNRGHGPGEIVEAAAEKYLNQ